MTRATMYQAPLAWWLLASKKPKPVEEIGLPAFGFMDSWFPGHCGFLWCDLFAEACQR